MMDADVAYTFANIDKARRLLAYEPTIGVAAGVQRFLDWYVANVGAT
jgi:nucleoside-diphosphate-sugar epimerase